MSPSPLHERIRFAGAVFLLLVCIGAGADVVRDTFNGEAKWVVIGFALLILSWVVRKTRNSLNGGDPE